MFYYIYEIKRHSLFIVMGCVQHKHNKVQRNSMLAFNTRFNLLLIQNPKGELQAAGT